LNLLLIEDNPGDADLIREMLAEESALELTWASSLEGGCNCLQKKSFSLILLDLSLPDSLGLTTYFKMHHAAPHIPIVVLTGNKDESVGLLAVKGGAQDYLVKGLANAQLLLRTISYAVERKRFELTLAENEKKLRSIVESVREVIFHINSQGVFTVLNSAWTKLLGFPAAEYLGKPIHECIYAEDRPRSEEKIEQLLRQEYESSRFEVRFLDRNAKPLWMEVDITRSIDDKGQVIGIAGTLSDISQRKKHEEKLVYMATHDDLTGLPNRNLFEDRLNQAIAQATRMKQMVAVIFLDLDHFKMVNDSMGHDQGDILLRIVASRLVESVRSIDTVARLGGDEFVIVLTDLETDMDAIFIANKILKLFEQPVCLRSQELYAAGSIGIAMFPRDGENVGQLVRNADTAMYRSKDLGRNQVCFYSPEMNAKLFEQLTLENDLRRAIHNDELKVLYQPKLTLSTGRLMGFEALLRWQHPTRGMIGAEEVITMAESSDLILKIGRWVLHTACKQMAHWQQLGYSGLTIAVNLSLRQFWQNDLVQSTVDILAETGLPADQLELEITESNIMRNPDETISTLHKLNDMGITLSIDDFGTGYSSLSYLKRFPIDTLKIDQSFVRDITDDPDAAAITQAIIALAHTMNLHVIAEGVQTEPQFDLLQQWNCDAMQGYLFSMPLTCTAALDMLQQQSHYELGSRAGASQFLTS
jgi:diguanylate cyclase (GGDEF)-like protein/PAS domain S-box-containing protein